ALVGLTAQLEPGTIGLVGPNGAGKTTLLRLLLGMIPPTSGSLRVFGHDSRTDALAIRERVGYMPEHDCLIPTMTAVGFVAFMGRLSGLPKEVAIGRAHDVLQFVGLREERYRRLREYSVGMRQRVKLAQALVHDPPLCFLDEPTAGLDPKGREEMLALLRSVRDLGHHSLILSTHLLPDVEGLCDQLLMLNGGRLLAAGPLATLLGGAAGATVIRYRGDADRFSAALREHGLVPQVDRLEIRVDVPASGYRDIFQAAYDTKTEIRYLGRSVRSVEDLFLSLLDRTAAVEAT
ncbi:MAG: ABC transporter ATP-binding protein, partial [Thermoplasmata archaeon]|nr:ABC transporter ATP-binding protein [Thermoplasmata archaeon]